MIRWFREDEIPRGVALEKDGSISLWFHGKASCTFKINIDYLDTRNMSLLYRDDL